MAGFYAPLLAMFDRAMSDQFLRPQHRAMVLSDDSVGELLDRLTAYRPIKVEKWLDRDER